MFAYLKSMKAIEKNFGISIGEQLAHMQSMHKYDLYPSEFFFEGLYLGDPKDYKNYVGIRQANRLWSKYNATDVTIDGVNLKQLLASRSKMNSWLAACGALVPEVQTVDYFLGNLLPFVTKEDNSFGGKGVRIHNTRATYAGDTKLYAEQYLKSMRSMEGYYYGTVRSLVLAQGEDSYVVSTIQKYRHESNPVDNRNYAFNALAPVIDYNRPYLDALVVDDVTVPHVREMVMTALPPKFYKEIEQQALTVAKQIPLGSKGNGVLLGFDTLPTLDGSYVLEVNNRPGFGIMQVAHREGGKSWLK